MELDRTDLVNLVKSDKYLFLPKIVALNFDFNKLC